MIQAKSNLKLNKYISFILFIVYVSIVITMLFHHEQWRDEAQSWLIARDLSPLEIIAQMKYEGHPFLWHYLLAPFAKLRFPYITGNIISALICSIAVILLLKKSPFSNWVNLLIICSSPFLYYAFVARSYCLAVLLTVLLSIFYKKRTKYSVIYGLLIGLLANTHSVMLGLAIMLFITEYVFEIIFHKHNYTKQQLQKHYIGMIIAFIGIATMLFIACLGSTHNIATLQLKLSFSEAIQLLILNIKNFFYCLVGDNLFIFIILIAIALFLEVLVYEKQFKTLLIFLGSIGYTLIISSFKYPFAAHTIYAIMLLGLFSLWISYDQKHIFKTTTKLFTISAIIIFGINGLTSYKLIKNDLLYPYSASKDTAHFINENIKENSIFICTDDCGATSIIPHLTKNMTFIWPVTNTEFTFIIRNEARRKEITTENLRSSINTYLLSSHDVYILHVLGAYDKEIKELENIENINKVYYQDNAFNYYENYQILKVCTNKNNLSP